MKIKNNVSAKLIGTLVLSSALLLGNCKKDDSLVENMNQPGESSLKDSLSSLSATKSSSSGYNITNALPKGYVKNGTKDYTSYIQSAINKYSVVTFPGFPIMVNSKGLRIPSNRTLNFSSGSELRLKPTSDSHYVILKMDKSSNVTLNNPVIIGDRAKHSGRSGEWGMGIGIYSGNNITIKNAKVTDCWGDGIYVAASGSGVPSKNIVLSNAYCSNNRRDGISIISAVGLKMESPYAGYSNGTSPYCGINIEPGNSEDEIQDITINNPTTEANKGNGIQMGFSKLYGGRSKKISVTVTNHVDNKSYRGLKNTTNLSRRRGSETVSGKVYFTNSVFKNNTYQPLNVVNSGKSITAYVKNPKVLKGSKYLSSSSVKNLVKKSMGGSYNLTFSY